MKISFPGLAIGLLSVNLRDNHFQLVLLVRNLKVYHLFFDRITFELVEGTNVKGRRRKKRRGFKEEKKKFAYLRRFNYTYEQENRAKRETELVSLSLFLSLAPLSHSKYIFNPHALNSPLFLSVTTRPPFPARTAPNGCTLFFAPPYSLIHTRATRT